MNDVNHNPNLKLNLNQVLEILLRALDHIDVRLVDHGHRVAYTVYKMMQADGSYSEEDMREISIVAALHDIGAYKTEEIDNMMQFESERVFDHSIYGYLFLKHMSPLKKWARVLLYHHLNYKMYRALEYEHLGISDMIHLADRIDVVIQTNGRWIGYDEILAQQEIRFGRNTVELFIKADKRYDIMGKIMSGAYLKELTAIMAAAEYDEQILIDYIKMIAYSIDFRSETTVSHVAATVGISMELGKLFGLDENELRMIQLGAYLHDIGKISTPVEILEKPGKLTDKEMQVMRSHIDVTWEILMDRIHEKIVRIAGRHHEKLDGSGYPNRLTAEHLTLSDRIVAVADMMSALTGKRSYKESFAKETVIDLLNRMKDAGKLCGRVIDIAVGEYDKIMEASGKNIRAIQDMYGQINKEFHLIKKRLDDIS